MFKKNQKYSKISIGVDNMATPLYIKTHNSLLNSLIKIDDLISFAVKNNINALSITDDNMFGAIEFYNACIKNNIKPIIGLEVSNIILYAINYEGYKNLIKLATIKSKEEITNEILKKYADNLICIVLYSGLDQYEGLSSSFKDVFKGYRNLEERNNLSGTNLVYCNPILCLEKTDLEYLKYLYLIKGEQFSPNDNDIFNNKIYQLDDQNNEKITNLCNIEIPMHQNLIPPFPCPNGMDSYSYLKELVKEGLKRIFQDKAPVTYINRVKYELEVINKMGFCDYFLIVYDYVKYAKDNDILVGPGRGSAAGSLIAYLLNITTIDPIKYNLLFERFLNPERITMPDIDIDFEYTKRDDVLNYCIEKYGIKKVAPIITFGTLGSKQVIRDVGRVLDVDLKIVDQLAKLISPNKSLRENYKDNRVKKYLDTFNELQKLYKIALKLEGLKRHTSIHAAGIVICKYDIDEVIPLEYHDNYYLTGYSMEYLEDIGLLKMDLLALKNLTLINNCLKEIDLTFDNIPLDDDKAINIFKMVNTLGIFQFESSGMMQFLAKFKPSSFDDVTACIALYRPGPMQNIDTYIKRKDNIETIEYLDDRLIPILKSTYGIIVYQEQIMMIANILAGYTLAEADILRKAMTKKDETILLKEKEHFVRKCDNKEVGTKIYELILKFASYGFNKAHSVSYAMIAYKMAYIKAYYPLVFMKHLLSMVIGSEVKTREYIVECKKNNIEVLKPDINLSNYNYIIIKDKIMYPLTNIKGIGHSVASIIIEERKKGLFKDIYDFVKRCDIGTKTFEELIKAGCFDSFKINQKTMDENIERLLNYSSLGELGDEELKPLLVQNEEYSKQELIKREVEIFGFYLSKHPVTQYRHKYPTIMLNEIHKYINRVSKFLIYVERYKQIETKKGDAMFFITGSDEFGVAELVMFPNQYKMVTNDVYLVTGKIEKRYDKVQIIIKEMDLIK